MQIITHLNKLAAAAGAGEMLNNILSENKNQPILLLLSAGSAFEMLDYVSKKSMGENLTISMLDDRFSTDEKINNFAQFQNLDFYKDALEAEASFIGSLPRPEDTMETLRQRWEERLKKWREDNAMGIIVATLGMGPEGHTAGIFPYPDDEKKFYELFQNDNWITAYSADGKNQYPKRLTATLTFFAQINEAFAFVCGQDKKQKLDSVVANKSSVSTLPATSWNTIEKVTLFTDLHLDQKSTI